MKNLQAKLEKKLADLKASQSDLELVRSIIREQYPKDVKVQKVTDTSVKIITPSAVLANELRLRQVELIKNINKRASFEIDKLIIQISSFD